MPFIATFGQSSCTLISETIAQGGVNPNSGNILVTGPNGSTPIHSRSPYPPFYFPAGVPMAAGQFIVSGFVATPQHDIRHDLNDAVIWIFEPKYLGVSPTIPPLSKIKKMTWRAPCSCNGVLDGKNPVGPAAGRLDLLASMWRHINNASPPINSLLTLDQGFTVVNSSVSINATYTGSQADWVVFDIADPINYIPLGDFIVKYKQLRTVLGFIAHGVNSGSTGSTLDFRNTFDQGWSIIVEYELGFTYQLDSPIESPAKPLIAQPGDIITFSSSPIAPDALHFDLIQTLTVDTYDIDDVLIESIPIPSSLWITWLRYQFRFRLPLFINFIRGRLRPPPPRRPRRARINITSTQFAGSLPLQTFTVALVDASGIYKLVPNQKYDTYYNRDVSPITTINGRIPDPFIKTGFIKG